MKTKHHIHGAKSGHAADQLEHEEKLLKAIRYAEEGHLDRALSELGGLPLATDAVRNARGVCLLRMGKFEEAIQLFRRVVLAPGCTWLKRDLPVCYLTNFCTALLLGGHPAGCFNCLSEISDQKHPLVLRLRKVLSDWEQQLPWGAWLLWKLGVDPGIPVEVNFTPGAFSDHLTEPPTSPQTQHAVPRAA